MRVLTIGLGGAGSHITDKLLEHDRMGEAHCVEGIAVDSDADELASLAMVDANHRLFFSQLDPVHSDDIAAHLPKEEILTHLQGMDDGDIDALFLCCGLGGTLASVAPDLVSLLKISLVEPVFGICTLPRKSEGDACLARAADQLNSLLGVLDGVIVFDNEAWREKISAAVVPGPAKDADTIAGGLLEKIRPEIPKKPVDPFHESMDTLIARRMTLLLRAGEFSPRDTGDLPEVVLDAGEILNTIQGMGLVTVGYAREELPPARPLDHLLRSGLHTRPIQEHHVKASRIVELAKRAVYQEISADTDLARVQKALVLIVGPSREMSMKGFMTVRRWLDRSIQGLELRAGDYPVKKTRYVGILVIFAGMDTLPCIEELRRAKERSLERDGAAPV